MTHPLGDRRLFFVAGQGKSGTSWLQLLLDAHPAICCRGEGHFADRLLPAIAAALNSYSEFISHNNAAFEGLPDYLAFDRDDVLSVARDAMATLLMKQPGADRAELVGERTPANLENMALLDALFPTAGFIHITRDPRDIAVSMWFHGLRVNPGKTKTTYGSIDELALRVAPAWIEQVAAARRFAAAHRDRCYELSYESLHDSFESAFAGALDFLGVDARTESVAHCHEEAAFRRLSGREPGHEDRDSYFRKGVAGDWVNHLDPETADRISRMLDDNGRQR